MNDIPRQPAKRLTSDIGGLHGSINSARAFWQSLMGTREPPTLTPCGHFPHLIQLAQEIHDVRPTRR